MANFDELFRELLKMKPPMAMTLRGCQLAIGEGSKLGHQPQFGAAKMFLLRSI
jgi:hypothetical protein